MSIATSVPSTNTCGLLGPSDPPLFSTVNSEGRSPALLVADHGGRCFPAALGRLGLEAGVLDRHIAYDIGIDRVTRRLAAILDAPALIHHYSRLLLDPNRPLDDPTSICAISDGAVVPGNLGLTDEAAAARADALFHPYHAAIDARLEGFARAGIAPAFISMHSFTTEMKGVRRPWHIGVLWADDERIPLPLMAKLAQDPNICVGDNQPYSGRTRHGYTVETHAMARGLPNVLIEIRQDLIATDDGADAWADRLAGPLREILADPGLYRALPVEATWSAPHLSLGMEEEYLLVDPVSRDLLADPPPDILKGCEARLGSRVSPEFLRAQIEVGTPVCASIHELRTELTELRRCVSEVAAANGAAVIAASTHPFANWQPQKTTKRDRYLQLEQDLGVPLRRLLICAMHVHVGVEDPELRIDLMNQVRYFLPHLLALTTSSPFWQGDISSLKSYRLAVFDELPRTGMPETYLSYGEYEKHLRALIDVGVIEDGTKVWWDVRPSARFPTLEMRICDICTRIDDAVAVAALFVSLLRMLWRLKRMNVLWRRYKTFLINENRWRAMRYGIDQGLIDFGKVAMVPYADLLEELLVMTEEDAAALGCTAEVAHARKILTTGTSAHAQVRVYEEAVAAGADKKEALQAVVDWLIEETKRGA